jgi:hypothetical protein
MQSPVIALVNRQSSSSEKVIYTVTDNFHISAREFDFQKY